jgi:hypothetical protein
MNSVTSGHRSADVQSFLESMIPSGITAVTCRSRPRVAARPAPSLPTAATTRNGPTPKGGGQALAPSLTKRPAPPAAGQIRSVLVDQPPDARREIIVGAWHAVSPGQKVCRRPPRPTSPTKAVFRGHPIGDRQWVAEPGARRHVQEPGPCCSSLTGGPRRLEAVPRGCRSQHAGRHPRRVHARRPELNTCPQGLSTAGNCRIRTQLTRCTTHTSTSPTRQLRTRVSDKHPPGVSPGRTSRGCGRPDTTVVMCRASSVGNDKHATGTQHAHDEHAATDDRARIASAMGRPRGCGA